MKKWQNDKIAKWPNGQMAKLAQVGPNGNMAKWKKEKYGKTTK